MELPDDVICELHDILYNSANPRHMLYKMGHPDTAAVVNALFQAKYPGPDEEVIGVDKLDQYINEGRRHV